MPFARNALITGLTSSPVRTKSPVIAALPPPVGWKLMRDRHAHRPDRRHRHAILGDRIAARHVELIDAAIGLSLGADDVDRAAAVSRSIAGGGAGGAPASRAASC